MSSNRTEAVNWVLNDLDNFEIDLNIYYDDAEPRGVIDSVLSGKIASLRAFCQLFGWSDLDEHLRGMTPLQGNAVESLESIRAFVIPERKAHQALNLVHTPDSRRVPGRVLSAESAESA